MRPLFAFSVKEIVFQKTLQRNLVGLHINLEEQRVTVVVKCRLHSANDLQTFSLGF